MEKEKRLPTNGFPRPMGESEIMAALSANGIPRPAILPSVIGEHGLSEAIRISEKLGSDGRRFLMFFTAPKRTPEERSRLVGFLGPLAEDGKALEGIARPYAQVLSSFSEKRPLFLLSDRFFDSSEKLKVFAALGPEFARQYFTRIHKDVRVGEKEFERLTGDDFFRELSSRDYSRKDIWAFVRYLDDCIHESRCAPAK